MRITVLTALGVLAFLVCGCATLPNVERIIEKSDSISRTPSILSSKGWLSEKQSKALIDRVERSAPSTDTVGRFNDVMEIVTESPLTKGNKIVLLKDGPVTLVAMFKAIESAKDHINIETFISDADAEGKKMANALIEKVKQGVQVNVVYDSRGVSSNPKDFYESMRKGGINVLEYNPMDPSKARGKWELLHADHRKIMIVDGRIAITGGINISGVYSSKLFHRREFWEKSKQITDGKDVAWRDTDVQIEGPAVLELQKLFLENWAAQKGPKLPTRNYFPQAKESGDTLVRILGTSHGAENRLSYISYFTAITFAEHSIHLTNAYFLPDKHFLQAIIDAAKRGVDVKLVLPQVTDSNWARNASHYNYQELMDAGVKIYELRGEFLHAKTGVIDGVWSNVGSSNMDTWSLQHNDEIDTVVLSRSFAEQMEAVFSDDLKKSDQIDPKEWPHRKVSVRIGEWIAHLFRGVL